MKQIRIFAAWLLLAAAISLSSTQAGAVETFELAGPISQIGGGRFTVENREYRVAPGAKLRSFDSGRRRLSDFKVGDVIIFTGKIISGVYYVELIIYHNQVAS